MRTASPSPPLKGHPRFQRLRVITALMLREMTSTYGRSIGGYFWAIAQPLGGIVLLAVAFSLALRSPPLGTSFILFYSTGMLPFSTFNVMSNGVSSVISSNRGLLSYPVVTAIDAVLARFLLDLITQGIISLILLWGIVQGLGLHINLDLLVVVRGIFFAAVLGAGIGTLNCVLFGFFPTWKNIWAMLTRPLFLVSAILYIYEDAPQAFQQVMWFNPLVHLTGSTRAGVFGAYDPQYISFTYVLGIALGSFVIGAWLLRRHESFLIEQ